MAFAADQKKVPDCEDISAKMPADPKKIQEVADLLWADPSMIDAYLNKHGSTLPEDHRQILISWKQAKKGRYILERHLKNGSIFISTDDVIIEPLLP